MEKVVAMLESELKSDTFPVDGRRTLGIALLRRVAGGGLTPALRREMRQRAVTQLAMVVGLQPTDDVAWQWLARAQEAEGHYEQAAVSYRKMARLRPGVPSVHEHVYRMLALAKKWDEALVAVREWVEAEPESYAPYEALGDVFRRQGHEEQALAAYKKSVDIEPMRDVVLYLGFRLCELGRWKEADAVFARGEDGPGYALAMYGRGVAHVKQDDTKSAGEWAKKLEALEFPSLAKRLRALIKAPASVPVLGYDAFKDP
jgi:Tfp pilus assembly protein PilF